MAQPTEPSTPRSEEKEPEVLPVMSLEEFLERSKTDPVYQGAKPHSVTYRGLPTWKPGQPVLKGEALDRRCLEIDAELDKKE